MREITVAAVQMDVQLNAVEDNVARMAEWIARVASEQRVDLIVFPELVTTGYECGARFTEWAQRIPGPSTHRLAQRAREFGVHVVFGMAVRERVETILYNSAVVIGPDGETLGAYHKVHLKGEERLLFRGGYRFPVFETGFGMLGVLLGWDLLFPGAGAERGGAPGGPRRLGTAPAGGVADPDAGTGAGEHVLPGGREPGRQGGDL